jgi:hypothetical protein
MPDNPPISTTVPETVSVDTGADKETISSLTNAFDDFWQEQDKGPAQETKPVKEAPRAPPPPEAPERAGGVRTPLEDEVSPSDDIDVDKFEMDHPEAFPGAQKNFGEIKQLWKADRGKLKAEVERAKALEAQLDEARKNAWTPEAKADYEHAASIRRKFDFVSDPDFIQQYHVPVYNKFQAVLEEAVSMLPDRQAAQEWAQGISANYQPDALKRDWWLHSVIDKVPDDYNRATLLSSVNDLLKLQKDRDQEVVKRTNDKSAFDNWITEKSQNTAKRVQEEIMAEIGEQEKRIAEVLPRDIESAKTKEERAAIEQHNERFQKLNKHFVDTMHDLSKHGPRAWVRASVEATRAKVLEEGYNDLQKELKTTKAERDQLRSELDKITGVRRKISHTTGTPPSSSSKNGQGLSIKSLDVRDAFKNYDWGDQ